MGHLRKILSPIAILLAFVILVATGHYSIDFHYCQGEIKSFSLFGKAKNCHQLALKKSSCKHHQQKKDGSSDQIDTKENKKCCHNETVLVDSELNENLIQISPLESNKKDKTANSAYALHLHDIILQKRTPSFKIKPDKPPLSNVKLIKLYSRYLC